MTYLVGLLLVVGHCNLTLNDWNHLSHDCVNASSVNMFKNKIDNYLPRVHGLYLG